MLLRFPISAWRLFLTPSVSYVLTAKKGKQIYNLLFSFYYTTCIYRFPTSRAKTIKQNKKPDSSDTLKIQNETSILFSSEIIIQEKGGIDRLRREAEGGVRGKENNSR